MGWNNKCQWGTPAGFSNATAAQAVAGVDFRAAVFVNISAQDQNTKAVYAYYVVSGYRICVVGHVHKDNTGHWTRAGNCFIPGWEGDAGGGWQMQTPNAQIGVIGALNVGGVFPGDNRYPHPVPPP